MTLPTLDKRIPVYLLTGYLGSGKTSLLKSWLTQAEFKEAALVINELGEVGLDNQLLSGATESSALVANACVCCTGLPGLAEALEDLFWARLERRMPRFPNLVIETTGLAEPGPVAQALASSDLLKERYRLAGVITCLSASTADAVLKQHAEARAQLAGADVLILTKTDLVTPPHLDQLLLRLEHHVAHLELPHAPEIVASRHASLTAQALLQSLALREDSPHDSQIAHPHSHEVKDEHAHAHGEHSEESHHDHGSHEHSAQALWWPVQSNHALAHLQHQVEALQQTLGTDLLRLKGRVQTAQGNFVIQLAPFETAVEICADALPHNESTRSGLTVIVCTALSSASKLMLEELKLI